MTEGGGEGGACLVRIAGAHDGHRAIGERRRVAGSEGHRGCSSFQAAPEERGIAFVGSRDDPDPARAEPVELDRDLSASYEQLFEASCRVVAHTEGTGDVARLEPEKRARGPKLGLT